MILIINLAKVVKLECLDGPGLVHHGLDREVEVGVGPPAELNPGPHNPDDQPPSSLFYFNFLNEAKVD